MNEIDKPLIINCEFILKFDLLKLNFESNYNFYWKKDRLILIDNFIDSGSIINIKFFFLQKILKLIIGKIIFQF